MTVDSGYRNNCLVRITTPPVLLLPRQAWDRYYGHMPLCMRADNPTNVETNGHHSELQSIRCQCMWLPWPVPFAHSECGYNREAVVREQVGADGSRLRALGSMTISELLYHVSPVMRQLTQSEANACTFIYAERRRAVEFMHGCCVQAHVDFAGRPGHMQADEAIILANYPRGEAASVQQIKS